MLGPTIFYYPRKSPYGKTPAIPDGAVLRTTFFRSLLPLTQRSGMDAYPMPDRCSVSTSATFLPCGFLFQLTLQIIVQTHAFHALETASGSFG